MNRDYAKRLIALEVVRMKKLVQQKGLTQKQISIDSGITQPNVWRFLNGKSTEPTMITFLLIAKAIGYELNIKI